MLGAPSSILRLLVQFSPGGRGGGGPAHLYSSCTRKREDSRGIQTVSPLGRMVSGEKIPPLEICCQEKSFSITDSFSHGRTYSLPLPGLNNTP